MMRLSIVALLPLALGGCVQPFEPPAVSALTEPANPETARFAPAGPGVTYTSRAIEAPGDWRGLNDAQGPGASR
ncbi:hypothetical protein ACFQ4E_03585 [Litorisediminicola beolgyonensis]|uniref:Uncharacterized protein n=1 Tax=Litorisediminicola beolgyonensis TaxID=1173614 RepID=A0ABW3ZEN0_9RHOB